MVRQIDAAGSPTLLTNAQRELLASAFSSDAEQVALTPLQRLAIREVYVASRRWFRGPDQFLVAFKTCLDDVEHGARVPDDSQRVDHRARFAAAFIEELYGMDERSQREDGDCRGSRT
jgi:hypothetical protein